MGVLVPVAFFSPTVIDTTSTNIPASASLPLQVVADIGVQTAVGISFSDTTGNLIGVYIGAAGHETLACVIGNGVTSVSYGTIPAHSRVSVRNLQNAAINFGLLQGVVVTE